ncbi:MAG: hypothetical protein AAF754_03150 [Pseudomonadota bacterium]
MKRQAFMYGAVMAGAVFFVGLVTGLGGSVLPNLGFSILMGGFAAVCYVGAHKLAARQKDKTQ